MKTAVIITGTTSGLGHNLMSKYSAQADHTVICVNRKSLPVEIEAKPNIENHIVNISSPEQVDQFVHQTSQCGFDKYIFILNAAVNSTDINATFSSQSFSETIRTNLLGVSNFIEPIERHIQTKATVIFIGSTAVLYYNEKHPAYYISKFAVHTLFKQIRRSNLQHNYKLVYLGPMLSPMSERAELRGLKRKVFHYLSVTPDEVADIISSSESKARSWIVPSYRAVFCYRMFQVLGSLRII